MREQEKKVEKWREKQRQREKCRDKKLQLCISCSSRFSKVCSILILYGQFHCKLTFEMVCKVHSERARFRARKGEFAACVAHARTAQS